MGKREISFSHYTWNSFISFPPLYYCCEFFLLPFLYSQLFFPVLLLLSFYISFYTPILLFLPHYILYSPTYASSPCPSHMFQFLPTPHLFIIIHKKSFEHPFFDRRNLGSKPIKPKYDPNEIFCYAKE